MRKPDLIISTQRLTSSRLPAFALAMDNALEASAAIAGILSLTIQITQVAQRTIAGTTGLSRSVRAFLDELVCFKKALLDIQDAMLLNPGTFSVTLPEELVALQGEMEVLRAQLHESQRTTASTILKTIAWSCKDEETARWASCLNSCRQRIHAAFAANGL